MKEIVYSKIIILSEFEGVNENGFNIIDCHEAYKVLIHDLRKKKKNFARMVAIRRNAFNKRTRET